MTEEDAIRRIEDFGLYHAIKDLPYSTRTVEAFEMAIEALKQQRTNKPRKGEWIPCSEMLPEDDDVEVLCTVKQQSKTDHSETIIVEQGCYFYGTWLLSYDNKRVNCIREVLAWMPLPEPYQEKGEESE